MKELMISIVVKYAVACCVLTWTCHLGWTSSDNHRCACSGDVLTFECTVVDIGSTVWEGSAFECDGTNYDFIALRHSEFNTSEKPQGVCNNGGIFARAIGVVNNRYTSQLMLTMSPEINNRTVECVHDHNLTSTVVDSATILLATGRLTHI